MTPKKRQDLTVLIALAIFAVLASLVLHATFLVSTFLFLGLPSIYLSFRARVKRKETFLAVLVFGGLYSFLLDYAAELNGAWAWKPEQLIFKTKILGVVSPDSIIWTMLWILFLVLFYEHFLERDRKDTYSNRVWYAIVVGLGLLGAFVWFSTFYPTVVAVQHAYFFYGLCTLPPFLFAIYKRPALLPKLLKAAAFFIPLYLAYELTGRYLGQWDFPGHYFGMIQILGITFPLEEFMFWICGSSVITLAGYEFLIDDMK